MPSIRQIAFDWDCARSYVQRCVRRGCPTESFEAARLWRQANQQRSRNPAKQAGRNPTPDAEGLTTQNVSNWRQIPEEIGDDFIQGTKEAVRQSWRYLREALIEGKVQKIGAWISLHTRAVEASVKAESMVRGEMERQKILIPLSEAMEMARRGYGVILQRLNTLPQNAAHECNPSDPSRAMNALESECSAILCATQEVYAGWSEGGSHISTATDAE